jgi:hypothetical protein
MRIRSITIALITAGTLCAAWPAVAQYYGAYGYPGAYGGWGGAALEGSDYRQSAIIQARSQSMIAGRQAALQQSMAIQNGIRNTLSSQAQSRDNSILSQQQATQDWFFQQQQKQTAQRQAAEYAVAAANAGAAAKPATKGAAADNPADSFAPQGGPSPVANDVIKWPPVLQESCFASERAVIEAPYRRTPPKLSMPDSDDYRRMATAVEDMKAVLEWRLTESLDTAAYDESKAFLQKLEQEIASRLGSGGSR